MKRREFLKLLPLGALAMLVPPTTGPTPEPTPTPSTNKPNNLPISTPYLTDADNWYLIRSNDTRLYHDPNVYKRLKGV